MHADVLAEGWGGGVLVSKHEWQTISYAQIKELVAAIVGLSM